MVTQSLACDSSRTKAAPRSDASAAPRPDVVAQAEASRKAARRVSADDVKVPPGYEVEVVVSGLSYLSDITFGPHGETYLAEAGGHTFGTSPSKAPPARILQLIGGRPRVIFDRVVPLEAIREADTYAEIPEGIIPPITGVTYNPDNGLLYVTHRTRISTLDPRTGRFVTIVDDMPDWGEFHLAKVIFGPDEKMYFSQATQGNLGPIDSHFMRVITALNKPNAREVPCEDVTLRGIDFWVRNGFTKDPHDAKLSGVYVPFGETTRYGQVIPGEKKCNGAMYRANPDGTDLEVIAWGLRSNYGYRFSPSGRLVATQNSCNPIPPRQVYDDWEPIYEIEEGAWYGWPEFCSSVPITDERFLLPQDEDFLKEYGQEAPEYHTFVLTDETRRRLLKGRAAPPQPMARLPVHSAAQGMVFGQRDFGMDPENEILVAQFGNIVPYLRDEQPGYKVVKVDLRNGKVEDFLTNRAPGPASATGNRGLERPIMVEWSPDGALYVVDFGVINITKTGMHAAPNTAAVWRVTRAQEAPAAAK